MNFKLNKESFKKQILDLKIELAGKTEKISNLEAKNERISKDLFEIKRRQKKLYHSRLIKANKNQAELKQKNEPPTPPENTE